MSATQRLDPIVTVRGENSLVVTIDKKSLTDVETREELLKIITLNLDVNGITSIVLLAAKK